MLRVDDIGAARLAELARRYRCTLVRVADGDDIPGSHWGAPEAGLCGERVYYRHDTPLHSLLHEFCHRVCMDAGRRATLHTDAGGDDDEECAVCLLQFVLAGWLGVGEARLAADMDAWGYSFREGGALAWLAGDARDAARWLRAHGLIDEAANPTWRLAGEAAVACAEAG